MSSLLPVGSESRLYRAPSKPMRNHHSPNFVRSNTYTVPASIDSKPLTLTLSSLDATLTKNAGRGC